MRGIVETLYGNVGVWAEERVAPMVRYTIGAATAGEASGWQSTSTPGGSRTPDPWFRKPLLYPLSYRGKCARLFASANYSTILGV